MQTNTLFACRATPEGLYITTARDGEVASIHEPGKLIIERRVLRPVELRWLAYASENFGRLHALVMATGAEQTHPLTILPDEEL